MDRTRRKDDGREEFEVVASIKQLERECCERHRKASDCELPEWFGCQVDSENIAPSRIVGCAVHVLSQSEKRRDDHNVRGRLRTRRSRAELMLKSETVNPEYVRGEMGKLDPGKATETSLDRTNGDGERMPQGRTTRKRWQPHAFTNITGVPKNPRELAREPMKENRKKYISKSLIQRYGETPGSSECLGASSRHTSGRRESLDRVVHFEVVQHIHQTAGTKRGAEDHPMSSAKRAHAIHPPVPQILSQLRVEMEMMPVPEDAMEDRVGAKWHKESQFDVGGLCRQDQHGSMSAYLW